jgi:protein-S-isoprenylcysteine O-methyltransferase Ste14
LAAAKFNREELSRSRLAAQQGASIRDIAEISGGRRPSLELLAGISHRAPSFTPPRKRKRRADATPPPIPAAPVMKSSFLRWFGRTPVQTFILSPLAVVGFELVWRGGEIHFVPWGVPLLAWGYLQYRLVGRYRLREGGGGPGMAAPPRSIVAQGPYAYCRNPMYLGHLIFMLGLALTFSSAFALLLFALRAAWFQYRVMGDEARLAARFGADYEAYRARVKRWIPGLL